MPTPSHRAAAPRVRRAAAVLAAVVVVGIGAPALARYLDVPVRATATHSAATVDDPPTPATAPRAEVPAGRLTPRLSPDALQRRAILERQRLRQLERERQARLRERAERAAERKEQRAQTAPISFRIGTFNVLGSQHTAPGGSRQKYPPASVRTPAAAGLVASHGVDVLGTQELQADQLRGLQSRTGMAAWPGFAWGEAETDNSILFDDAVFEFVEGGQFTITFMGRPRPQPWVRLRHRDTGREFFVVNTHPSAGGGQYAAERRNGQATLVAVVNDLKSHGLPVLVTGDMNDREAFYCNVAPQAGLVASNGGSWSGGCQPPPQPLPVDWVVGNGATWTDYRRDTSPVTRRISDHFFISATAHFG